MRIVFRVDAGSGIGTGHVSRCLALAHALGRRGAACHFVQRPHTGAIPGTIREAGFEVTELAAPTSEVAPLTGYAGWLGATPEADAADTRAVIERLRASWLVVDHYGADADWEARAAPVGTRVLAIDDLANRPHACDLLLDQNYFARPRARYAKQIPQDTDALFGPMYAPLRPEYADARPASPPVGVPVARANVFYGGTDPGGETERAVRVLADVGGRLIPADAVVCGSYHGRDRLEAAVRDHGVVAMYGPRPHLADLIAGAQLALGAGGATAWQRCTLGVPTVVTTIADHQNAPTRALAEAGGCVFAGESAEMTDDRLRACVAALLDDPEARDRMALNAWLMTDGRGAERTAEIVKPTPSDALRLRPAEAGDKYIYFVWANDPAVRSNAYNPEQITWPNHDRWFDGKFAARDTALLVLETPGGLPLGQVRVDSRDNVGEIDYVISVEFRGRGLGGHILGQAADYISNYYDVNKIFGYVMPHNIASHRAFRRAGFKSDGVTLDGSQKYVMIL